MTLDGNFENVDLYGSSNYFMKVGNQKFNLGDLNENYITLKNFDGKISFDERKITSLEGKVSEVDKERGKIKVLVNMFGRDTPVELDSLQIKKVT